MRRNFSFILIVCLFLGTAPAWAETTAPQDHAKNLLADVTIERVDSYPGQPHPPGPPTNEPNYPPSYPPTYPPSYPPSYPPTYPPSQPGNPGYQTAYQLYQNGMTAYRQAIYQNAIYYFGELVSRYPYDTNAPESCFLAGESARQVNQFYQAMDFYRRVVNSYYSYRKVDEAAYFIGFCLVKVNDFQGAINEFRSFIYRFPTSQLVDNAWYVSGRMYEQVQDTQNAIFCYRKVVYNYPNSDMINQARERLQYLENSSYPPNYPPSYPPSNPPTLSDRDLFDRGHTELARGNFSGAIIYFDELVKRYPSSSLADDATLWKAKTYIEQRDYTNASKVYARFKSRYPNSELIAEALYGLGWSYYQIGMSGYGNREYFPKAAAQFIDFTNKFGYHQWAPEALFLAGESYERYGDINSARSYYREVVNRYPNTPSAQKAQEKLNGMY